jgi:hypothetical protein
MSIKKMLLLASMALAAIALAAPAAAQAKIQLTKKGGAALVAGNPVTAVSTNLKTTVGANTLECGKVTLHYSVAANGTNHVVLNAVNKHNATAENCKTVVPGVGTFTNHITEAGTGQLTINTWGTGVFTATFTSNTTTLGLHCSYHGNVHVQLTPTLDIAHVKPAATDLTGTPIDKCGPGKIHGEATLESGGVPIEPHFVNTG